MADILHVRDEKSTGTNGGNSTAGTDHVRTLNTVVTNSITGASLASDRITLPAGTYDVSGSCPSMDDIENRAFLYNITDAGIEVLGQSAFHLGTIDDIGHRCFVLGRFTIDDEKVFELRHYIGRTLSATGLGIAVSDGRTEIYGDLLITAFVAAAAEEDVPLDGAVYRSLLLDI